MDNCIWLVIWYFIGVGVLLYHLTLHWEYVTIRHIIISLLMGMAGPLWLIVILLEKYSEVVVYKRKKKGE